GSKRMVSVVQRLMDHTDLRVVRSTIFGARLSRGNASHQYKRTMLRLVTPYIDGSRALKPSDDAWEVVNEALELPRSLFPKQAWSILTSPSVLRPDNPAVADIVWDLCECRDEFPPRSRRPIPAELLWRVFEAARDRKVVELRRRDAESCMGFSLILAAEVDPHRSRHEATSILKSRKPSPLSTPLLRDAAKRALRACQGVPELSEVVARFHRDEKRWKGDALNVLRAHEFAQEVIQDGFDLYFHNTGKHWLAAHRGLVLLKQRRAARLLSQGAKIVFGSQTRRIATNAEAVRAWDSLPDAKRRRVEHMEDEAQTFAPSVFPAAEKYVQAHAKLFR
ncbi:MAG TPA: hypothetical protein VHN77_10150, partial [Phycisphaerales bacterium]|nr:hypothetical protein [Phycisphaerales bacterium]